MSEFDRYLVSEEECMAIGSIPSRHSPRNEDGLTEEVVKAMLELNYEVCSSGIPRLQEPLCKLVGLLHATFTEPEPEKQGLSEDAKGCLRMMYARLKKHNLCDPHELEMVVAAFPEATDSES